MKGTDILLLGGLALLALGGTSKAASIPIFKPVAYGVTTTSNPTPVSNSAPTVSSVVSSATTATTTVTRTKAIVQAEINALASQKKSIYASYHDAEYQYQTLQKNIHIQNSYGHTAENSKTVALWTQQRDQIWYSVIQPGLDAQAALTAKQDLLYKELGKLKV